MIHFSQHLKTSYPELFLAIAQALNKHGEQYTLIPHTADYWCRDYMPIPLPNGKYFLYQYFPDYLNNNKDRKYITKAQRACEHLGIYSVTSYDTSNNPQDRIEVHTNCTQSNIILDGGNVVRCGDKVVMVDKIFKENQHYKPSELISQLETFFNAQIVLLPWDKYEKYGHSDGIVRHIEGNKVLLTNYKDYDPKMHETYKNILEEHFEVHELSYSQPNPKDDSWAYINFLQTDKLIILPKLGTHKDQEALIQFETHFPSYKGHIEFVDISPFLQKGGGLNCISWNATL